MAPISRAEELVVAQLAREPRDADSIRLLAEIRLDQHRYRESLELLNEARELGDFSSGNRLLGGLNYMAVKRLDLAEPELRAATLDASNSRAFYYLGRLLYTKNQFADALANTQKAISLDPAFIRAYDNLGLCYQALGDVSDAKTAFLDGIHRQEETGQRIEWPALDLGAMLIEQGAYDEAKPYIQRAIAINPDSAEAHDRFGQILEEQGNLSDAISELQRAVALDPKLARAHYRAAHLYQRIGKADEARRELAEFQKDVLAKK